MTKISPSLPFKLTVFAVFAYLWYFEMETPQFPQYHWIAKRLNFFAASNKVFQVVKAANLKSSKKSGLFWFHYQLLRDYFVVQFMWKLVWQLLRILLLQWKPIDELSMYFVFEQRFQFDIWVDFVVSYVLNFVFFEAFVMLFVHNVRWFVKIRSGVKSYMNILSVQNEAGVISDRLFRHHFFRMSICG